MALCTYCSTTFTPRDPRDKGKFCSLPCFRTYRKQHARSRRVQKNGYTTTVWDITCRTCGKAHEAYRSSAKYCSSRCQLRYEYESGRRDPQKITAKANAAVRKRGFPQKKGKPIPHLHNQGSYDKVSEGKKRQYATYRALHGLPEPKGIRQSREWRAWRQAVFERDHYACVQCGDKRGGNLEADHIRPRYLFPELTWNVDNGRTLCKPCHKATPTYGAKVYKLTRADFDLAA